jgi:hypothetical protein
MSSIATIRVMVEKFGQTRLCDVTPLHADSIQTNYDPHEIFWVERPEDEYGLKGLPLRYKAYLRREDWLRGERDPANKEHV